jgi:hypothetical protein
MKASAFLPLPSRIVGNLTISETEKERKSCLGGFRRLYSPSCREEVFPETVLPAYGVLKNQLPAMPMLGNSAGITRARAGRDPGSLTCLSQRLVQPLARHPLAYLHRPGGPSHLVPVPCGVGLKFVLFPCVVVVVVVVPPGSGSPAALPLLPGGSSTSQTTLPWTFLQPCASASAGLMANAESALTERAATIKAANATIIIMRFIKLYPFLTTPTQLL